MEIVITGASGFVGTVLSRALLEKGHRVTGIGTSRAHRSLTHEKFAWVSADTTREGDWQENIRSAEVVINLTGKSIFGYWTKAYKEEIYNSRVMTTRHLVNAMDDGGKSVLLSTSAIGYYGDREERTLTENDPPGSDFLAEVCKDWEAAALEATAKGVRVVTMRFGVVLGHNGGALKTMMPAFKWYVGGPLGNGNHWFPWIHMDDLIHMVELCMISETIQGPVNVCSPGVIRQKEFARALGKALHRPWFMPAPAFLVKTFMGELGKALLSSQKAIPQVVLDQGFTFTHNHIDQALADVV